MVNQSLSRIGSAQTIASLSESSSAAVQGALWYPIVRDALLRDFMWPWATSYAPLVLVSDPTTGPVNTEWLYSYRYPTDCLFIRRLLIPPSSTPAVTLTSQGQVLIAPVQWRQDADPYPVPFEIGQDADGKLIYADLYTAAVTDPTQFAPDFSDLLVWRLAVELSYSLAISDARRDFAQKMYKDVLATTRANALNEQQRDNPYVTWNSEFTRARFNQ
jgi:hypothetical protein